MYMYFVCGYIYASTVCKCMSPISAVDGNYWLVARVCVGPRLVTLSAYTYTICFSLLIVD